MVFLPYSSTRYMTDSTMSHERLATIHSCSQTVFFSHFLQLSPLLQLCHVEEAIAVLARQLKLRWQREHGLIEIPQHGFHCAGVLMTVIYVVV